MDGLTLDLDGWVPIRVYPHEDSLRVDWCWLGRRPFAEPFFRDTINDVMRAPFSQAFRVDTPIDALCERTRTHPGIVPTAFVFHASRCGSTLVAQMLAALPTHVVLSEPPPLDVVLRAPALFRALDTATHASWLRGLVAALGQPRRGGESRLVVKLDAWHVVDYARLRLAFQDVPTLFLYRDPVEIAVSQWNAPGIHVVPGMIGPALVVATPENSVRMPRAEFVARVVGTILEAGRAACADGGAVPVHYEELPEAVTGRLAAWLGVGADAATRSRMVEASTRDAKAPSVAFTADTQRKRHEADPALAAAVEAFAAPAYRALEALRTGARAAQPV